MTGDDDYERMIGSPMVIKLKIPKVAALANDGETMPEKDVIKIFSPASSRSEKEGKRVCLECGKEFSSGKALGGHMRVHVQSANRNPNFQKPPKTMKVDRSYQDCNNGDCKPYYMNCVNDEGKPTCSQCGKSFPSMKSLFGHMRCHPERVWRGILPPSSTATAAVTTTTAVHRRTIGGNKLNSSGYGSSYSSEDDMSDGRGGGGGGDDGGGGGDQVVDLTEFLSGWSVTERRGRRSLKPPPAEEDEGLLAAAEDLMSLTYGGALMAEAAVARRRMKVEVTEGSTSDSLTNNNIHVSGKGKAVMEEELVAKMEVSDGDMIRFFSDDESNNINEQLLISYKIKKRKKMKLMMELEPNDVVVTPLTEQQQQQQQEQQQQQQQQPVVTDCKYKCTTCNKCFTSHQALGGHRSSHNKPKVTSIDRHPIEDYCEKLEKEGSFTFACGISINSSSNISNSNSGLHQCKTCDKIFATGQALGGHQRCHWTGGAAVGYASSSQITSTGEGGGVTECDRKVLDFDLNEVPPVMMEEDEGVNGNGYASSSINSYIC